MCCRWNPNLFFDLSGSTLSCKSPSFIGDLLWWTDSDRLYLSGPRARVAENSLRERCPRRTCRRYDR